jgi:transcriptional regulator with XRE-family HTH domain
MLALREAAGLTQAQLARAVGVPATSIAFWEWSDKPPRSDVIPKMAAVLGVRAEDILSPHGEVHTTRAQMPGPVSEVQKAFEEVKKLPRRQQRKVVEMVTALVAQYRRKAS